ncbi:endogenous retrovirus group K member 25 Pro protein-like [Talpa occidentalis]|uniref:endogenous retrovirus group K member 25 Pro protein-like n=1 Tax=Talpa occidentalis TaxID=50954 RepID=UPI00188DEB94|nr:endogenous retrovirus group K member 25 Pro protein-like [Talpa occidentalis]
MISLLVEGKHFMGLLDTGADVSVIAQNHWPSAWKLTQTNTSIQGVGSASHPSPSSRHLHWTSEEGHNGYFKPYVLPHIPMNLWGRDVMSAMDIIITTNSPATRSMVKSGYSPGKGLGKNLQGDPLPVSIPSSQIRQGKDKSGLGFTPPF